MLDFIAETVTNIGNAIKGIFDTIKYVFDGFLNLVKYIGDMIANGV